ncbi:germination protein [Siminovitchia terrae]|uniref:Germination protein n=1 Tax=Siminovitchia terrae TaxID=1914933 RepID=A0A429X9H4_SIMTE|nr:endospore germination permease [Siminovitchia terrae]RST60020.1 hypothetical protein D5F11_008090 [Siminovitchia terrae]GIN92624.1 germination protein [Siminovitchia terrae]GIN97340.1 germination protein [Siminovitchia terrae]
MVPERISGKQLFVCSCLYTVGSAIIYIPHTVIVMAKHDAWISSFLAVAAGLLLSFLYISIHRLYPGLTLIQILESTFGTWAGKIVGLFTIVGFFYLIAIMALRDLGDLMVIEVMPETPQLIIHFVFLIVIAYSVKHGLEVIARTAEILFPFSIGLYLITIILLPTKMDFAHLLPIGENGWKPIVGGMVPNVGFPFFEVFIFTILLALVYPQQKSAKPFVGGVFLGGMMVAVATLYSLAVLGVEYSSSKLYAPYILGTEINFGDVIQRIEVVIGGIWFISIYIKICLVILLIAIGLGEIFNLKDYRLLTLPLCLLLLPLSITIMPNIGYWNVIFDVWPFYGSIFAILLPVTTLLIGLIKGRNKTAQKGV